MESGGGGGPPGLNSPNTMFPNLLPSFHSAPPLPPPAPPHPNFAGFPSFPLNPGPYGQGFQQPPLYNSAPPPLQPPPLPFAPLLHPPSPQQFGIGRSGPGSPGFRGGPVAPFSGPRHGVAAMPAAPKWPVGVGNVNFSVGGQLLGRETLAPGGLSQRIGPTFSTSNSSRSSDGGAKFVDQVLSKAQNEENVDISDVLGQIRGFVAQVQKAVHTFEEMTNRNSSSAQSSPAELATCPHDRSHRFPAQHLFGHALRCPSNPKPNVDLKAIIPSLQYPRTIARSGDGNSLVQANERESSLEERADGTGSTPPFSPGHKEENVLECPTTGSTDIWGSRFFYQDAAAVVQTPLPPRPRLESPRFAGHFRAHEGNPQSLLASKFWLLQREIELWTDFPTRCSSVVLQAAKWLPRVRREVVLNWILLRAPAQGVVLDISMGNHVESLAIFCLQSLQGEASALSEAGALSRNGGLEASFGTKMARNVHAQKAEVEGIANVTCLDCPNLFDGGRWMASQLSSLFGPLQSKTFVLELVKHCVGASGQNLASPVVGTLSTLETELGKGLPKGDGDLGDSGDDKQLKSSTSTAVEETVDRVIVVAEIELAIEAVYERSILETYLRSLHQPSRSSKMKLLQEHDDIVQRAAHERASRPQYKSVLEHDGLVWHRSQTDESGKNKTRAELLAEERDYKRRRMSYRGKKLKRSPAEVLHDIIMAHMEEIAAAGGIGCFTKDSSAQAPTAVVAKSLSSRGSNTLMNAHSPAKTGQEAELPVGVAPENPRHERESWNRHLRKESTGQHRWSHESSASKASKQSHADSGLSSGSLKQSRYIPREKEHDDEKSSQHSFRESSVDDSYRTSRRHRDHPRSHSRSRDQTRESHYSETSSERESRRSHHRESDSRWETTGGHRGSREDHGATHRYPRYEYNYSDRWEGSSDDIGYHSKVKDNAGNERDT